MSNSKRLSDLSNALMAGKIGRLALICAVLFSLSCAAFAQAPSMYSAYTGTDAKTIPPAPALGPANSVFSDPTFGSKILRVTDQNTNGGESFVPTDSGFHRSWNADSTAIKLTGPHGDGYWLEFNPSTFKVGNGTSTPAIHSLPFTATWEWSTVDPDIIYFLNGSQIAKYNKSTGVTTNLAGTPNGDPVTYMAVVLGQDNWVCSAAGPGVQDSYTEIFCVNPISPGTSKFISVVNKTINGTPQGDPNWPTSASGATIGIHDISGGTGASWLEVTFHNTSWGGDGSSVLNLGTNTWSTYGASDPYWSGHVSMGNGKYANSSGSQDGRDSRGILLRNPDNLTNSSNWQFVSQPPTTTNGWCDADHLSWLNSMSNPNAPVLISRYYANASNCAFAWTGEIYAAAVDGSNAVWRFAHNHSGGCYYSEGFAQISNDGHWALFSSYWDGTLGSATSFGCSTRIDTFIVQLTTPPPPTITTTSLPGGTQSAAYSAALAATSGTTPYSWSVASGSLPAGLSLSSSGVISGTPTGTGTASFAIQVVDAASQTATASLNLTIAPAPQPPTINTTSLPSGTQNTAYSTTLTASGGTTPYTWSIASGNLPAGLTLSSAGAISGTPTGSGASSFTVQVMGANSLTATASLSIAISAAPTPSTGSKASVTRVEETAGSISYAGSWVPNGSAVNSGGSAKLAMDLGSRATFTFTGTAANWIGLSDAWSGIANVYVDGLLKTAVDTYSYVETAQKNQYSVTGLPYGTHTLTVEATGTKNSASGGAWVWVDAFEYSSAIAAPTATSNSTALVTRVEETAGSISYAGSWVPNGSAVNSGGSAKLAMDSGSRATFTFTGTAASWIGLSDAWSGIANVYVDRLLKTAVDTYSNVETAQKYQYSITGLPYGTHTLTVEATDTKNSASGGAWVWVDAFEYSSGAAAPTPAPAPTAASNSTASVTRVEETAGSISYVGSWVPNGSAVNSGGSAKLAMDSGTRATFTFTGTAASWIGLSDAWSGIANVYVDGLLKTTVDTYSNVETAQKNQYSITGLPSGTHTLTVEATDTKNSASGGAWVWVDAFEYRQ